nr:tRNA methyltransferase [Anaerolineae bacterium]
MKQLFGTPLKRFLRDWRRSHKPVTDIALVLQSVAYPVNVGSLFRIADAVGVNRLILSGITPVPPNQTITKVGRNKHTVVNWAYEEKAESAVAALKSDGYHIMALEITDLATAYYETRFPGKLALILGNEDHGMTRSILELCDSAVFVPMFGKGRSLNVHVTAAVVLYHVRCQEMTNAG